VALGQSLNVVSADARDSKVLWPTHPLQSLETFKWDLAATGHELQELGDLLFVGSSENLEEPDALL
jgi:hypothetical protein